MKWSITFRCNPGFSAFETDPSSMTMRQIKAWIECHSMVMTIYECDGNQSEMARRLGLSREHIRRKCNEYGLNESVRLMREAARRKRHEGTEGSRDQVRGRARVRVP